MKKTAPKSDKPSNSSSNQKKVFSDKLLFPKEFLFLLLVLPLSIFLFHGAAGVWFQQPGIKDVHHNYLGGIAMIDPDSPFEFSGPWIRSGNRALIMADATIDELSFSTRIGTEEFNQISVRVDGPYESEWSLAVVQESDQSITRTFYGGENALQTDETRLITFTELEDANASETLTLEFRPIVRGNEKDPMLRRVEVTTGYRPPEAMISFPDFFAFGIFPFIATLFSFYFLNRERTRSLQLGVMIGFLYGLAYFALDINITYFWYLTTLFVLLMSIKMLVLYFRAKQISPVFKSQAGELAFWLFAGVLVLCAMQMRWQYFEDSYYGELGYDASGYVEIASKGGAIYATDQSKAPWVREPLFPWALRVWFDVFKLPETQNSARIASLMISVFVCILAGIVGRRIFGPLVSLAGLAMLAFVPEWGDMSVRVLRHDMVLGLILIGLWIRNDLSDKYFARGVAFGLWSASLFLIQFSLGIISVPILIWEGIRKKWKPLDIGIALVLLGILVTPHLIFNYQYKDSGDPMYSSSIHTLFYLNKEHIDEEGFPTALEFRENPYVGEPVSTIEFFFKYHSVPEVVYGFVRGYFNIFAWIQPRIFVFRGLEILMLPGLLGGFYLLFSDKWWTAIYFAAAMLPFAFLSYVGADNRLGMEATIFSIWVWMFGIQEVLAELRRRRYPDRIQQ